MKSHGCSAFGKRSKVIAKDKRNQLALAPEAKL